MTSTHELIGSVVDRLNSNLIDEFNGTRVGSYTWGPDQDILYNKYMPKIQVTFEDETSLDRSFGTSFLRTKPTTINTWVFSKKGDIGSFTGLKNKNLVFKILDQIETSLKGYNMARFSLADVGDMTDVDYNGENDFYYGRRQFVYKRRE